MIDPALVLDLADRYDALTAELRALAVAPDPEPPPPPPPGDLIVVDSPTTVRTLHVMPHQTLVFRDGGELIFENAAPTDPDQKEVGLIVEGHWVSENTGPFVVRSADPAGSRGHVMVMGPDAHVDICGVIFRSLGRTRKDTPLHATTNKPGRYALHFHRCGFNVRHHVCDCVAEDSTSWAFVNHSSLVDFVDCVADGAFGAAFMGEANPRGSFLRCAARNVNGDDRALERDRDRGDVATRGHGFWTDGVGVTVQECLAEDVRDSAYARFPFNYREFDTGVSEPGLPAGEAAGFLELAPFLDNEAYRCRTALDVFYATHPANRFERLTASGCREFGLTGRFTENQTHRGHVIDGDGGPLAEAGAPLGVYGGGTSLIDCSFNGFRDGVVAAHDLTTAVSGGDYSRNWRAGVLVQAPVSNPQPTPPNEVHVTGILGTVVFDTSWFSQGQFAWYQYHRLWRVLHDGVRLYHPYQAPDHVPFADAQYGPLAFLTNQQIYALWGLKPYGVFTGETAEVEPAQVAFNMPEPLGLHALPYYYRGVRHTVDHDVRPGWQVVPVEPEPGVRTALVLNGA